MSEKMRAERGDKGSSRDYPRLPDGLKIGHMHDSTGLTGCTVLLFEPEVLAACDIRGSAPATSNFSLLDPSYTSCRTDAIYFTGGSSFGLASVVGVQRFLEDRGQGFDVGVTNVPRVPAAAIFDLGVGDYTSRPTAKMALDACIEASGDWPEEGSVGAGMGATVGKFLGMPPAMRGGFGAARAVSRAGAEVCAFAVVNAFGDIWTPGRRELVAGARTGADEHQFADAGALIKAGWRRTGFGADTKVIPPEGESEFPVSPSPESEEISPLKLGDRREGASSGRSAARKPGGSGRRKADRSGNTTLIALVTTARLDILALNKLTYACHLGLADVVYPSHTIYDGDLALAVSMGDIEEDVMTLALLAQETTSRAILSGVKQASAAAGLPAWKDLDDR